MAANTQRHEKCSCDGVSGVPWTTTSRPVRGEISERERKAQRKHFQIKLVQNSIKTYNAQSANAKPTHESIEKLNRLMAEVEISIQNLHKEQHSCLESGLQEQRTRTENNLPKLTEKKSNLSDRNFPAKVKALDDFLQKTGGPYGGWDQCDHQVFLRIFMKHGGKSSYRKEVKRYLSGKTLEEIEQHGDWHQELLSLKEKNKKAVQHWKANKLQEQRQTLEDARKRELKEQRRVKKNMKAKQRMMLRIEEKHEEEQMTT